MEQLCIIIPVYNNPQTIEAVTADALETGAHVVVVDDGSQPEVQLPENERLTLVRHHENAGKGEAILTGGRVAKEMGFDSFIVLDGDGQHFPREVEAFRAKERKECIVIGCRRFEENVPGSSKFGRSFSNFWIWVETGLRLKDTQSGFRAYPVSVLELPLRKKRYDFEIEILVRHAWNGGCIDEVDISVYYPTAEERISHFDKFKDNVRLSRLHSSLVLRRWFGAFLP